MNRTSVALFLSLLVSCTPAAVPERVFVDSYFASSVNGQASYYDRNSWVYESSAYVLRYWLGIHQEGSAPGSIKIEISAKESVLISWDDSTYFYADGTTSPITHEGVPYGYRPADTQLESQTIYRDRIVPRENLVFNGNNVTNARYLMPRNKLGTTSFALELILNGEPLLIRLDGNRD